MKLLAKTQVRTVSPPTQEDRELLDDFASILQQNLEELFNEVHSHEVLTSDPSSSDGEVGDIHLVDITTSKYLVIRYADGWYKTATLTAL